MLTIIIICGSFWVLKLWVEEKERQEKSEKPVDGPRMSEKDAVPGKKNEKYVRKNVIKRN